MSDIVLDGDRGVLLPPKQREFLLYLELLQQLYLSRIMFHGFCQRGRATPDGQVLVQRHGRMLGACKLPGWREFMEKTAAPLNRKTADIIIRISELNSGALPSDLSEFMVYHAAYERGYKAWLAGEDPAFDFTAGRNFPMYLQKFVEQRLVDLSGEKEVESLLLLSGLCIRSLLLN